ncbi:hydrolase 76 protein [Phlyctochytrium bullatum]|nr:hydrolase 76 protein [Phlyctochytrium bullatum]
MKFSTLSTAIVCLAAGAVANTLDLTSKDAVDAVIKKGMKWLNFYYLPDGRGAWRDDIMQWHETALYFNVYMRYRKFFGDSTYDDFINGEMVASSNGDLGDFIRERNDEVRGGRWNDDIGWWALTAMTAAEVWGPTAIIDPSGPAPGRPWLEVANRTLYKMMEQYDDACGGGIYWSRFRASTDADTKSFKSTISNLEAMELAARIYALKPDPALLSLSDNLYAWMKQGMFGDNYTVYDGVYADTPTVKDYSCGRINAIQWSYQWGPLLSALTTWHALTKNQTYLDEAHKFYDTFAATFLDPTTGAFPFTEWGCNVARCKNPTGFAWPALKGLEYLYVATNDTARKLSIKNAVTGHAKGVVEKCTSADWNCVGSLPLGTQNTNENNGTNPRDQVEFLDTLLSLSVILGATPKQEIQTGVVTTRTRTIAPETAKPTSAPVTTKSAAAGKWGGVAQVVAAAVVGAVFAVVVGA